MPEHSTLTGASLHEPKGADAAASGTVYIADGLGSGAWGAAPLEGVGTATAGEVIIADGVGGTSWGAVEIVGQDTATNDQLPQSDGAGGIDWVSPCVVDTSILTAEDFTNQNPSALDTPLQVLFGSAVSTTEMSVAVTGDITCNVTGTYVFRFKFRFARTSSTGTSILVLRYLLNGVEVVSPITEELSAASDVQTYTATITSQLTATDVVKVEILRDSTGNNDGGLATFNPALAGWGNVPSASVAVSKLCIGA